MKVERRKLEPSDLSGMNIPPIQWKVKSKYVPTSIKKPLKNYLVNIHTMVDKAAGLFLYGSRGVGKTAAASLILMEARSIGKTGYFASTREIRDAVRNKKMFDGDLLIIDRCKMVDVLVIDDLLEDDSKEYVFNTRNIADLIIYRGDRCRVTVVTTKMSVETAGEFYDQVSGHLVPMEVSGPDLWEKRQEHLAAIVFDTEE